MVKTKFAILAQLAPALLLLSCAAPKAVVVEPAPGQKKGKAVTDSEVALPDVSSPADDGIRLPDMLAMPGDGEFRATSPGAPKAGTEGGAVISSRPPTDPPSRPKPKESGRE